MNAFEYRPKVGLFLQKTISRLLQKSFKSFKKMKVKKVIFTVKKMYCTIFILFYFI